MKRYVLILAVTMVVLGRLAAQSPTNTCVKSTEGRDFWFGFMENRPGQGCGPVPENYLEVTVTSRFNCQFTISLGNSSPAIVSDVLQPNVPKKFRIDRASAEPFGSETIEKKSLHLVSDQPLNLFAMNYGVNSADASVIFPVEALGKEYYAICYEPHVFYQTLICGTFLTGKNSEFVVVASEDQTHVTITPSKVTDKLKPAGIPYTIVLNKGELYQVQSMNLENLPGQGDLTGSHIFSDKPIALYSGSWAITIPNTASYALDHIYEQIPPVSNWGRKFVAVPFLSRGKDTYRILSSVDHTTIQIANKPPIPPLDKGQFYEFMLNFNEASLISSDQPVLLAQYSNSNDVDRPPSIPAGGPWDGDPSMLIVNPVDQTREESTFIAYDTPEITSKIFVNIVSKNDAVNQIMLDNNPIAFTILPNSEYSYAQVPIAVGSHNLKSTEKGKGFIAYVYGFGGVEGYGYSTGFNMSTQIDLGGDLHFIKDTILLCNGETKILDAGSQFWAYNWNTGETTQKISLNHQGFYKVTASTSDGCTVSDSVFVLESNPVINLGKDSTYCQKPPILLDAGAGFTSYKWSTKEITQKKSVSASGVYDVLAMNKYGCQARDTVRIDFASTPSVEFSIQNNQCLKSGTQILNYTGSGDELDHYNWDLSGFQPGEVVTNPGNTRGPLKFDLKSKPNTSLSLQVVSKYGCVSEKKNLQLLRNPAFSVFTSDSLGCVPFSLDLKAVTNDPVDQVSYSWDYGNSETGTGSQVSYTYSLPKESYDIKILAVSKTTGCSETLVKSQWISVFPTPKALFTIQNAMQCMTDAFLFSAYDNGVGAKYKWNLGDGTNATGKDLQHKYTATGHYDVSLNVTSSHGCIDQSVTGQSVYAASVPTISFSLDPATCLEPGNNNLNYVGTAAEKDQFKWDLSQLDSREIIQDPGSTSGPLIFNLLNKPMASVSLQVVSQYGCKTENKQLTIKRKPQFSFEADPRIGCPPLKVSLSAKAEDGIDKIDYIWDFGDGKTSPGQDVSHSYTIPDRYFDLSLQALSKTTGCSGSIAEKGYIRVYPKPEAGFSWSPAEVYNDQPDVSFIDQSKDAESYNWDFGDGSHSDLKEPSHKYENMGIMKVIQAVYNQYQCADTSTSDLIIGLRKLYIPNAFSPMADNIVDRVFIPYAKGVNKEGYRLKIFSRWNDVIFDSKNELIGWDGKLQNGSMAQAGNYLWIVEFVDFEGKAHRQNGTVMLIY